jgi:divalent metal cation (Fe/Co/Zn/Cd) transporter
MNKADWMTSAGPMVGVAGLALGVWWLDYVVAALISADILKDGIINLRDALLGLMDQRPRRAGEKEHDPLIDKLTAELQTMPGVKVARVRLREEGHVYFGDISVVLTSENDTVGQLERIAQRALSLDWRLYDLAVVPVRSLDSGMR